MRGVITSTLNATAKNILVDFSVTTQTWQHLPKTSRSHRLEYTREISTNDDIYAICSKSAHYAHHHAEEAARYPALHDAVSE
jgi:hypothetical protein